MRLTTYSTYMMVSLALFRNSNLLSILLQIIILILLCSNNCIMVSSILIFFFFLFKPILTVVCFIWFTYTHSGSHRTVMNHKEWWDITQDNYEAIWLLRIHPFISYLLAALRGYNLNFCCLWIRDECGYASQCGKPAFQSLNSKPYLHLWCASMKLIKYWLFVYH